jgi:hypothetical protein
MAKARRTIKEDGLQVKMTSNADGMTEPRIRPFTVSKAAKKFRRMLRYNPEDEEKLQRMWEWGVGDYR